MRAASLEFGLGLGLALLVAAPAAALDEEAARILARNGMPPEQAQFIVFDPADGRPLDAHRPDAATIPASVIKIVPALAALSAYGPDHRFATELWANGAFKDGAWTGDLILKGGGDVTLDTDKLAQLIRSLAQQGLTTLRGRLLYDAGLFPERPRISGGFAEDASYNVGVGPLSANWNRVSAAWRLDPKTKRHDWTVRAVAEGLSLPAPWIAIAGEGAGAGFAHRLTPEGEAWTPPARVSAQGQDWLPVRQPGRNAAMLLRAAAARQGVTLPAPLPGAVPTGAKLVARVEGGPLGPQVAAMLKHSNNLSAEMHGMAAAARLLPKVDTQAAATAAVTRWLQTSVAPKADWRGFVLANFSGLETGSRATPRQIAALLTAADAGAGGVRGFRDYLPRKHEIREAPPAQARKGARTAPGGPLGVVRAKSGTLAQVRGLAGFIERADGSSLGFVILQADLGARAALDAQASAPGGDTSAKRLGWNRRAAAVEAELLRHWAKRWPPAAAARPEPERRRG